MSTQKQEASGTVKPALKSGLDPESQFVFGESREEFAQLQTEHYHHYAPANPEERLQVDNLIRNEWFLRRFFRVEAQLWEYHSMLAQRGTGVELGEAFSKASPVFTRLWRRVTAAEKAHKEAKVELDRLKARPLGNTAPDAQCSPSERPQPQETTAETQQLGSFLTDARERSEPQNPQPPTPSPNPGLSASQPRQLAARSRTTAPKRPREAAAIVIR